MDEKKPEELEIEPIAPKKYSDELEELAKKLEEVKSKRQTESPPEFKVAENPKSEIKPGEPAMSAEVGDVLVSKSGTRRKVLGFHFDRKAPGGGYLEVETAKEGATFKESINFEEVMESKKKGVVTIEKTAAEKLIRPESIQPAQENPVKRGEIEKPLPEKERVKMAEKIATSLLAGMRKEKSAPKARRVPQKLKEEAAPTAKPEEKAPEPGPVSTEASVGKPVRQVHGKPAAEKPVEPEKLTDEQKLEYILKVAPGDLGEAGEEKKAGETKIEEPIEPEKPAEQPAEQLAEMKAEVKEEPIEAEKPVPEPESGEPENPAFKTEEALNDQEFLEFLTKYPDAEKIDPGSHQREIEKRHKVFHACKVLGSVVGEFYNKEAGQELGLPIEKEMSRKMLDTVEREAIADPESLIKRAQEIVEYENLKNDTTALDKQLAEFGGVSNREDALQFIEEKLHKLSKEKHQKRISVGFIGFINPENNPIAGWWFQKMMTEEERAWHKQIREAPRVKRKEIFAEIDKKIEAFAKAKEELEKVNEVGMRRRFDDLRQELFQKFEPTKMLFEDMRHRAVKNIGDLFNKAIHGVPGIKKIEEARQYLEKLRVLHKKFALDVRDQDAFALQLDRRLEELVDGLVRENIKGFKITSEPLKKMLSEFSKLVDKGSGVESKQALLIAIVSAIDKAIDHLKESGRGKPAAEGKEAMMKKILLQAVKVQLLAELTKQ